MKYLTPEIEKFSKQFEKGKSLIQQNESCGIFQNTSYKKGYKDISKFIKKL